MFFPPLCFQIKRAYLSLIFSLANAESLCVFRNTYDLYLFRHNQICRYLLSRVVCLSVCFCPSVYTFHFITVCPCKFYFQEYIKKKKIIKYVEIKTLQAFDMFSVYPKKKKNINKNTKIISVWFTYFIISFLYVFSCQISHIKVIFDYINRFESTLSVSYVVLNIVLCNLFHV